MKVNIVSISRSHLLNLAISLDKKEDVDVAFYTLSPRFYLRKFGYKGKVVSFFFPLGLIVHVGRIISNKFSYKYRLKSGHTFRKWFDICTSLFIKPCDVLVGNNGDAIVTSRKAKRQFNSIIICDQGSVHIKVQDAMYKEKGVYTNPWNTRNLQDHYAIADYLMTATEYVKNSDIENGISKDQILYNPYGVDIDKFKLTDKPSEKSYDIIFVGNWSLIKGCDMLVEACRELNLRLLHVGKIIDLIFPEDDIFTHIGYVPEYEIPSFFAQAKVFILPSRNEGFGMVLLQAASCGLPVVGSTRTGVVDLMNLLKKNNEGIFIIDEPLSIATISSTLSKAMKYAVSLPEGVRSQYVNRKNLSWGAYGERYYRILLALNKPNNVKIE